MHPPASRLRLPGAASLLALLLATGSAAPAPNAAKTVVVLDDFESYAEGKPVPGPWWKAWHGNELDLRIAKAAGIQGSQALQASYLLEPEEGMRHVGFCLVKRMAVPDADAIRFWFRPDGSGHHLLVMLNVNTDDWRNIHDLWTYKYRPAPGDTTPRWVVIPFSALSPETRYANAAGRGRFVPAYLGEIAIIVSDDSGKFGRGVFEIDGVEAIRQDR